MEPNSNILPALSNNGLYLAKPPDERANRDGQPFIVANTIEATIEEVKKDHIIPVFTKDNETLISHTDFIDITNDVIRGLFEKETILSPQVRLSHPVKGRVPEAKDKPAHLLESWEKTIYYERMMFIQEIASIRELINGDELSLTVGGVKAYNQDNLYSRSLCDQHFKVFIGFQNKVCANLCVWTDGYMADIKVKNPGQLKAAVKTLLESYNQNHHLFHLKKLVDFSISDQQFANLIGRCRMYHHLPQERKTEILPIQFGDQQVGSIVKDYYRDNSFCRDKRGNINLWKLYNLFTGVNKSTYIDSFLDRSVNAFTLVEQIRKAVEEKASCWYLN